MSAITDPNAPGTTGPTDARRAGESRTTRALLDDAGMSEARIVASDDLEERQIAHLTAGGAPIDSFGVGTDLGTRRDSPVVNGIYTLVAHQVAGEWRDVRKLSPEKATTPGAKQVFRDYAEGEMRGDVIARAEDRRPGRPLLAPFVRGWCPRSRGDHR